VLLDAYVGESAEQIARFFVLLGEKRGCMNL
jgi:hypothetical protein